MRVNIILIYIFLIAQPPTFAQPIHNMKGHDLWIIQERAPNKELVFETNKIIYYGLDFSLFSISLKDSTHTEKEKISHIPAWISEFEFGWLAGSIESSLSVFFNKSVLGNKTDVQSSYKKMGDDWLHAPTKKLELDTLEYLLAGYPESNVQTVGLSIVVEVFEEHSDRATVNFLFFDSKTKGILWNLKMIGWRIGKYEFERWSNGLKNAYAHFKYIYKERHRNYIKLKRKINRKNKR